MCGVRSRLLSLTSAAIVLALCFALTRAARAIHYVELRQDYIDGHYEGVYRNNRFEILHGNQMSLHAYDSEGHLCRITGLGGLNPAYANIFPAGSGEISFPATCTELGDHTIYAECPFTQTQFPVNVRVKAADITANGARGSMQVHRTGVVAFWAFSSPWDPSVSLWKPEFAESRFLESLG